LKTNRNKKSIPHISTAIYPSCISQMSNSHSLNDYLIHFCSAALVGFSTVYKSSYLLICV